MSQDSGDPLTTDEFVDYCKTQAGLLSGSVETMGAEVGDLLDEIDEEMAEIRSTLDGRSDEPARPQTPPSTGELEGAGIEAAEKLEVLETKQALVEAKQARMRAYQELAADYTELAASLRSEAADGRDAMERVVRFEAERDAPAYFPDRQTVCEAAASSSSPDTDSDSDADPA